METFYIYDYKSDRVTEPAYKLEDECNQDILNLWHKLNCEYVYRPAEGDSIGRCLYRFVKVPIRSTSRCGDWIMVAFIEGGVCYQLDDKIKCPKSLNSSKRYVFYNESDKTYYSFDKSEVEETGFAIEDCETYIKWYKLFLWGEVLDIKFPSQWFRVDDALIVAAGLVKDYGYVKAKEMWSSTYQRAIEISELKTAINI